MKRRIKYRVAAIRHYPDRYSENAGLYDYSIYCIQRKLLWFWITVREYEDPMNDDRALARAIRGFRRIVPNCRLQ